jgi:hypothetical protein
MGAFQGKVASHPPFYSILLQQSLLITSTSKHQKSLNLVLCLVDTAHGCLESGVTPRLVRHLASNLQFSSSAIFKYLNSAQSNS